MNPHDRSRQEYYEDEYQSDYYQQAAAPFGVEQLPYPGAAAHMYQQNVMMAEMHGAYGNGMQQYGQQDMMYYDEMQQNGYNNVAQQAYYEQSKSLYEGANHRREHRQEGAKHRRGRMRDSRDDERYSPELYQPHSSTTRTETERTGGIQTTSSSRSTYSSSTYSSGTVDLGEGIMSALNDMAGNLKSIGGIRCNQAGPDTTELKVQLNLPLPFEGFNQAMATLSPKDCTKNYDYENLDTHVMGIQENMMPVYKSLFESQSASSDESDESESTYEDERFLSKNALDLQQQQRMQMEQQLQQQRHYEVSNIGNPNKDGIPLQIEISNQPSGISSNDSWNLMSPRDRPPANFTNNMMTVMNHTQTLNDGQPRDEQLVPASRQTLEVENVESKQMKKPPRSKPRDMKPKMEVPKVIDLDAGNVVECYSDLTTGHRRSGQRKAEQKAEKEKSVPAIKTQFSGDEAVDQSKTSFQRNSAKKGTAFKNVDAKADPPDASREAEKEEERRLKEEHEKAKKLEEEREKAKKLEEEQKRAQLEEEQKQREAEAALAAKKALRKKKLEEKVEAELQAARALLRAKKLEEERKQREAEEKAAEQRALEEKRLKEEAQRLEEERKLREAEERAKLEAERLENERKRIEAEAKAKQMALEAKRLEGERLQREAEEKAAEEARKAQELERERKRIEAETKAAQEALEALYAKKLDEERRQREEEERTQRENERKAREARKLKEVRERVEAEARAAEEEAKKFERERMRIEAETKATLKNAFEAKKLEKERKRLEAEKKAAENARRARKSEKERKQIDNSDDMSRASLYKVQGFNDYCKSVASFQVDGRSNRHDIDLSDDDTRSDSSAQDEDSTVGTSSSEDYSNSGDSYTSGEGSYTDASSDADDLDDVRSASSTERLRNHSGINHPFSSSKSVKTVRSVQTKDTGTSKSFSTLKRPPKAPSKYTSDEPIPITATMSTLQTTFDQGTVVSGHHSLGRFIKSSDESVVSTYSHASVISSKPIALPVNTMPREIKKKSKPVPIGRSSIVGTILSYALKLGLRVMFTVILFVYTWLKHLVITIGKKQEAKLDCTPTKHALQPDQAVRREEIQERVADNRVHQKTSQQLYLGYENPKQEEHYATTMIIKPPNYMADDSDEVGTCVESIVPNTHYPNMSDGKMSKWNITHKNTDTSSLSSPPSTSFRVLKSAYSALSSSKREEKSNWLDHATIDDEMSYYE